MMYIYLSKAHSINTLPFILLNIKLIKFTNLSKKKHTQQNWVQLFLDTPKTIKGKKEIGNHPLFRTGQLARSISCRLVKS